MTPTLPQQSERYIQNAILRAYATRPDLRIWRMNTGKARFNGQVVQFGVPGQADLTGILPDGRRLEIEVKSPTGRFRARTRADVVRACERLAGNGARQRTTQQEAR